MCHCPLACLCEGWGYDAVHLRCTRFSISGSAVSVLAPRREAIHVQPHGRQSDHLQHQAAAETGQRHDATW